ncbi:MAG: type II toxin-antitoxin system PemK/MazF family toxin [Saprospiraceae bacterium]
MNQGEIWNARFDPTEGREQSGARPVIIVSGNTLNDYMDLVIVCPLTSSIKKIKKCLVIEPTTENNLSQTSQILPFQIRTLRKERLFKYIGSLENSLIDQVIFDLNYFLTQ